MPLVNTYRFTKTIVNWDLIAKATHNQFQVVSVRPYVDKKGELPEGHTLTLKVIKDDFDYGLDKSGQPRENNLLQNFEVTVLSKKQLVKKGDYISLFDFDAENSYVIKFDMILRFKNYEVLKEVK